MSMTLVEAAKASNDKLQAGLIEKFVYDDPIFDKLKFKELVGNGLSYYVETTMSGAGNYAPGDTWLESTQVRTKLTADLAIFGGDADVDNFIQATRSDTTDLMQEEIDAKIKAVKKKWMEMFFYGYYNAGAGFDAKGYDGLHALIKSQGATATVYDNTVSVANTSGTGYLLSLSQLEQAVDYIRGVKPDLMIMSKAMRRGINKYLNGVGGITKTEIMGKSVQTLFDVPVMVSDYIIDTEDATKNYGNGQFGFDYTVGTAQSTTSDAATTIFVVKFDNQGVCGLQRGAMNIEKFPKLETKDASRARIKWYSAIMLQKIIWASKVTGILVAGVHTA